MTAAMRGNRRAPAYPYRRRLLAAVTALFATISLACIPAATARSGHEKALLPAVPQLAPNAAQIEATAEPVPATPVKPPVTPVKPSAATAKPTKRSRHVEGAPGGARHARESGVSGAVSAQPLSQPGLGEGVKAALASEQRRVQEGAGKVSAAHVSPAKAKQLEASRSLLKGSGTGSGPTQAPVPVAAPAAATAATVTPSTTAAVSAPAPSTSLSAPASKPAAHRSARGGHRRSRTATSARGASAAARSAVVAGASASSGGAGASDRSQSIRHSGHRAASPSIVAPLATTITKIVDVVPTPVRALIGALLALALALAVRSRFAARRARRLEQQRSQLLEDVGLLQAALLPVPPARLGPVGTTAAYRPAAGGDFYDVFALEDGQLGVIVGDVSGHGRKALPHTALVRFTLRAYLEAGLSPRGAVRTAGSVLERQLEDSFVTVVAATYNPRTRVLVYASAGHPPPIVLGADDAPLSPVTVSSAPPIGVGLPTGTRQSIVSLPGRARICFHTDGVTEARIAGELFGSGRLTHALVELGPQAGASELLDRVADEADSRPDDMAACLLGVEGGTQPPHTLREELELDRETVASERTEQFLLACGLQAAEVPAVMHVLAAAVARAGSAVLEVHDEDGRARATLQHDNLAYLQTRQDARQAVVGASR